MKTLAGFARLFDPLMKFVDRGERSAIVLQSRAEDPAYLAARGVKNLIR
ncbi:MULTISPECIES: hypothetical protein [unclassified Actinomadura]|nr:hypothetical protein [Actinomadura sp. K4S16]